MTLVLAILAGAVVAMVSFYVGVVIGARKGADLATDLVARDNLVRLRVLGIDPAVWLAAGYRPSKTELQ